MQTEEKETEGDRRRQGSDPCLLLRMQRLCRGRLAGRADARTGGDRGLTPVSFDHRCGEELYLEDIDTQRNISHGTDDAEG